MRAEMRAMRLLRDYRLPLLLLILVLAFALRTYGLRRLVYSNPDEALWSFFIVTSAELSPISPHPSESAIAKILSWDYGYPLFMLDYVYVNTLEALGLPVNEATLPGPLVLFGTLSCLLVYLLALRFGATFGGDGSSPPSATGPPRAGLSVGLAGLIAAGLVAVMPLLVGRSRSIGGAEAFNGFMFLLALLMLMRYWQEPASTTHRWLAGLVLGLYLCADVQFLVTGTVLVAFLLLWPRGRGYEGWKGLRRLVLTPGLLLPPVVLFAPYVPAYLYAVKLGYPDQTYLGTILNEHSADWGFHWYSFVADLWHNMGLFPALLVPVALLVLWRYYGDRRYRWLLWWIGLTALPFLLAVTSKVTQVSGYHQHLVTGLALLVGLGLARIRPRPLGATLGLLVIAGSGLVTVGVVLREQEVLRCLPDFRGYGMLEENSGMKTAGYWVRQNLPREAQVFVAHDPAVSYWYMGREAITGGYIAQIERAGHLLANASRLQAAVAQGYDPGLMRQLGFPGSVHVTRAGREILRIHTRQPLDLTLPVEQTDRRYDQTYRKTAEIIPPPFPYVPGKSLSP